jgi:hypothetical protein
VEDALFEKRVAMKYFNREVAMLAFFFACAFIGIWHALPNLNVIADETYFVSGPLRAIQTHSLLPPAAEVPYGTLTFYLNYAFEIPFLLALLAWKGFHLSALRVFLILNPSINYLVPRFISALIVSILAWYYNRFLRKEGLPFLQRFTVLTVLLCTVISGVMLHAGKLWPLSMALALISMLQLYRALSVYKTDEPRAKRAVVWSIVLAFIALADFTFSSIFLVTVPILFFAFFQRKQLRNTVIVTSLLGALIPVFIFIINYKNILGQITGMIIEYHPIVASNLHVLNIGFPHSLALHGLQIGETFPFVLALLIIACLYRAIQNKLLFYVSAGYALLVLLAVTITATWYADPGDWLLYCMPYGFFFSGMVASLDYAKMRRFFWVLCIIQIPIYLYVLYLLSMPTTFNEAGTYIITTYANEHALIYNDVADLILPENTESSLLRQNQFCGEKCAYLRTASSTEGFDSTVITYQTTLSDVVPRDYTKILWVSAENLTGTCAGNPIAQFWSGATDAHYVSFEYNLGNYFLPDFWHLSHLGQNMYLYQVSSECMAQLPRETS